MGGAFRVVTTSLVPVGGAESPTAHACRGLTSPTAITVTFSGNVNPKTSRRPTWSSPDRPSTRLIPSTPRSLTWIDQHTVEFNLNGELDLPGTLNVAISSGTIKSTSGSANMGYSDKVVLKIGTPTPPVNPTPPLPVVVPTAPVTPPQAVVTAPVTPPPAVAPQGPLHKKKVHKVVHHPKAHKIVHHPAKKVVHHPAKKVVPPHPVKTHEAPKPKVAPHHAKKPKK